MRDKQNKFGTTLPSGSAGLSIVPAKGLPERKVVHCSGCLNKMEYTGSHQKCEVCGTELNPGGSIYSGYEPSFVPISPEVYHLRPPVRTVNERRHPRIPCRNAKACVKTGQEENVVDLVNISRGGVCFTSVADFRPGTKVSIATHYIEGGHNIYQEGIVVRAQHRASGHFPGEYAIEFQRGSSSKTQ